MTQLPAITAPEVLAAAGQLRHLLAAWRDAKDLIEIDAYVKGTNPVVDRAIALKTRIDAFTTQTMHEQVALSSTTDALVNLVADTPAGAAS